MAAGGGIKTSETTTQSKPATRPSPGHKLNTMNSKTKICKGYGARKCSRKGKTKYGCGL